MVSIVISIMYHISSLKNKLLFPCFLEPGYYEDGSFGIRLENVLIVKEASTEFDFGDKGYLSFEHITWVCFIPDLEV